MIQQFVNQLVDQEMNQKLLFDVIFLVKSFDRLVFQVMNDLHDCAV